MTPVDQTAFGPVHGNCVSASLASLLDIPLDAVPEFRPARFDELGRSWRLQVEAWLGTRGLGLLSVDAAAAVVRPYGLHYMAWGKASCGLMHSCVYRDGQLVHDPHPDRMGLVTVDELAFLVRLT